MKFIAYTALTILLTLHTSLTKANDEPQRFVEVLVHDLTATTRSTNGPAERRLLLARTLDMERITAGVLGDYRNSLSDEQIGQFRTALGSSFELLIGHALETFDTYEFSIGGVKATKTRASVQAIMLPDSGGRYEAVFSLAKLNGSWRAQNMKLNGVNLGLTYRNQFAALMSENSNQFDAVLVAWQAGELGTK
tara:strand:- start:2435 stop:3013 length:579 start_codon:yes stop_codon:yes gene_type:complete